MREGRRIERTITHVPGVAAADASWDDLVTLTEHTINPELDTALQIEAFRSASARVTAEFMRDAKRPLEFIGRQLEQEAIPA